MVLIYSLVPGLKPSFPMHPFHLLSDTTGEFSQYVDALPIPSRIQVKSRRGSTAHLTLTMTQFQTQIHRDLPTQMIWGYNGSSPGPIIEVERDQKLKIHWKNQLPTQHLFPAPKQDLALSMGLCLPTTPDVRTVTHLHGAEVSESNPLDRKHNNDGWPDSWILPGSEQIAKYPNHQSARTLWYHDHAMGTTGRNVAAGLAGFYLIHDAYERSLNLPSGEFDIPLMLSAHAIDDNGILQYTNDFAHEYYGNTVSVNGKLWPYLDVQPRKYRFRFVNGANARSYALKLVDFANVRSSGPAFYQIGSDSGFLASTVMLNDPTDARAPRLVLGPGERADIVVDFSAFAGKKLLLHNTSRDPGDGEIAMPGIMAINVASSLDQPDLSQLPLTMKPIPRTPESEATQTRRIVVAESQTPSGATMLTLNGKTWNAPIDEKPRLGSTEIWELTNTLPDVHPFHLHLVQFQILDRTPFDVDQFLATGTVTLTGPAEAPDANEMGWKDTVKLSGKHITRIIVRFLPYPGYYVYHCHILEHEDMDMMRPFKVLRK